MRTARVVHRWSSFGHGSRALLRDAASWAGRSASLDGGILSIRPRGQDTPKGTRTRLTPTMSASARLPADYMNAALTVSNMEGPPPRRPGAATLLCEGSAARFGRVSRALQVRFRSAMPDTPGEYAIRNVPNPCRGRRAGAILRRPAAPDKTFEPRSGATARNGRGLEKSPGGPPRGAKRR